MRSVTAAAVAVGFVCPAFADVHVNARQAGGASPDAPAIVVGMPDAWGTGVETVKVSVGDVKLFERIGPEHTHAVLTISLSTTSARAAEVSLMIELPRDARATGMIVNLGGERFPGVAMDSADAFEAYRQDRPESIDPAVLSLEAMSETTQTLELRASPITRAHAATISIDLDLPTGTQLRVAAGVGATALVKKTRIKTDDEQASLSVDRGVALYAGPSTAKLYQFIEPHDMVADRSAGENHAELTVDNDQSLVRSHARALRSCFAGERSRTKRLVGSAELGFDVTKAGVVSDVDVTARDHTSEVRGCIRRRVADWKFPATDDVTRISFTAAVVLP